MNGKAEGHVEARGKQLEELGAFKYIGSYLTAELKSLPHRNKTSQMFIMFYCIHQRPAEQVRV